MQTATSNRARLRVLLILTITLVLATPSLARAQDGPPVRVQPADVAAGDLFGCALDLDVDAERSRLLVGSLLDDDRGQSSGSAYVFELGPEGWVETAKLVGEATTAGNQLGFAVGIAGDVAVLGAPLAGGGGRGHVFTRVNDVWLETATLGGASGGAALGSSVAIDGRGARVALGAPSSGAGAVYLYALGGPGAPQPGPTRLVPAAAASGDAAGWSVALSGNLLATGAPYADPLGASSGAVYLFELGGGELPRLTAPGGKAFDAFGYSVALEANLLAVGAPTADPGGPSSGAVYLFRRGENGGFVHEATLPGVNAGDQLGTSVSLAGGLLAVGARRHGGIGAVHLFRRVEGTWVEVGRLQPGTASAGDDVGIAVALSGRASWRRPIPSSPG